MSKFLESLVRSEAKSCAGKIQFPREDSAQRSAEDMMRKKGNGEVFEWYKCAFGEHWHIGHRTNFDWIPESHSAYTLMINLHLCTGACNGKSGFFYTNTVISNRIMTRMPGIVDVPEIGAICPFCKSKSTHECRRIFVPLSEIPQDSTETIESLWERHQKPLESTTSEPKNF